MQFTPEQEKYFSVGKTHNRQGDLSREQIEALNQMLKESYVLAHLGRVQGAVNAASRGVSRFAVPTLNAARAAGRSVANLGSSALTSARNQLNSVASKVPFGNMLTKQRALPKFLGGRPATSVAQLTDVG
jgi:hypothetical protein